MIVTRYLDFFPKQTYPIRTGVHPNTAFGLSFAHDYARSVGHARLKALVEERARAYFARRRPGPRAVGARRRRFLLAEPDRGRPDEARAARGRIPAMVQPIPARRRDR